MSDSHLSAIPHFGPIVARFGQSRRARGSRFISIGLTATLGALCIAAGTQDGIRPALVPWSFGLGALFLFLAAGLAYLSFRPGAPSSELILHDKGFVWMGKGRQEAVNYDDIQAIYERIEMAVRNRNTSVLLVGAALPLTTHVYTIKTFQGRTIQLNDQFEHVAHAGRLIQQMMIARHLPAAQAQLHAGGEVPFGPLLVTSQGLKKKSGQIEWAEIASLTVNPQARLVIKRRGSLLPWATVKMADIPNFGVFQALVEPSARIDYPAAAA